MSSSKKLICKGTLGQVFICLRTRGPPPPPHCIRVYTTVYLFTQGRGGGGIDGPERGGEWVGVQ
jgi:hypothetical protein